MTCLAGQSRVEIYELLSCQELCHLAVPASDWLFTLLQSGASLLVDTTLDNDYN